MGRSPPSARPPQSLPFCSVTSLLPAGDVSAATLADVSNKSWCPAKGCVITSSGSWRRLLTSLEPEGVFVLIFLVIAGCALLTAVLALALVREVRLRRALEALLRRISVAGG